jgi:hypothetical protein
MALCTMAMRSSGSPGATAASDGGGAAWTAASTAPALGPAYGGAPARVS